MGRIADGMCRYGGTTIRPRAIGPGYTIRLFPSQSDLFCPDKDGYAPCEPDVRCEYNGHGVARSGRKRLGESCVDIPIDLRPFAGIRADDNRLHQSAAQFAEILSIIGSGTEEDRSAWLYARRLV